MCLCCFQKSKGEVITANLVPLVIQYLYEDYNVDKEYLPMGMCKTCKTRLRSFATDKPLPPFPKKLNCKALATHVKVTLRSERSLKFTECPCEICSQARKKGYDYVEHRKGKKPVYELFSEFIVTEGAAAGDTGLGLSAPGAESHFICSECFTIVKKGTEHKCNKSTRFKNIGMVLSPGEKQKIAAEVIRDQSKKAKDEGKDYIDLKNPSGHGPRKKIDFGKKEFRVPESFFTKLQTKLNLSDRSVLKLSKLFKKESGGKVPMHLGDKLFAAKHKLDDFFETVEMDFLCHREFEDGTVDDDVAAPRRSTNRRSAGNLYETKRYVVIAKNIQELISFIAEKRQLGPDPQIKIGKGMT